MKKIFNLETIPLSRALGADDFLIANLDMAGFYRVNYDTQNWRNIIRQLKNHRQVRCFLLNICMNRIY